jgi:flagellar biosynthesis chaperone FliJ
MILEGYLPVPPQNLWDRLYNYFSMNRQLTEKLIRIKEIEDDRDRYQATLDKSIEEELKKAYSSVDNYIQNETKNIIKYLKQKKQKDNTDSFNYKAHEDILKNLIGSRNDLVSEMIKKFSENREHATNVYISRLETEAKQSKQAQLFKLNSLVKMNGFGLRW